MRILVTGAAGFIGSNFVRYWLERHPDDHVVAYDLLTYAGNRESLPDDVSRSCRATSPTTSSPSRRCATHEIDVVVNFAAESHNSLAVVDPGRFFRTNVIGTQTLLEAARRAGVERFHHVSTCEVYGDLPLDTDEVVHRGVAVPPAHAVQRLEGRRPTTRCAPTSRPTSCRSRSRTARTTTGRSSSRRR